MLIINDLHVSVDGKDILKGLNMTVNPGEVHAIMGGPNGSGKSTLANTLAGHENYTVTAGKMVYDGQDLMTLTTEQRACEGLFIAFQYPTEIPGVSNIQFLKTALNSKRKYHQLDELDAVDFLQQVKAKVAQVGMEESYSIARLMKGFPVAKKNTMRFCKCWS